MNTSRASRAQNRTWAWLGDGALIDFAAIAVGQKLAVLHPPDEGLALERGVERPEPDGHVILGQSHRSARCGLRIFSRAASSMGSK